MVKGKTARLWKRSTIVMIAIICAGFGILIVRLFDLQIIQGESLQRAAVDQQLSDTEISSLRGTIYDSNMKPLAQSATVWDVSLEPVYLTDEDVVTVSNGLASILDMDANKISNKINNNRDKQYVTLKKKVENDKKEQILQFETDNDITQGIILEEDYKRYYPYGEFCAPVLGFTGSDSQGLAGLELYYDDYLTGTSGRMITAKNALGTDMPYEYDQLVSAENGYSLVLSIDEVIQHYLEEALNEGIVNNDVQNRATAVMMDVNTGEILGMAVKGDFDPNNPGVVADANKQAEIAALPEDQQEEATNEALQQQYRNKAVSDTYYPGSVFKIITASMCLQDGIYNENSMFYCSGSITPVPGEQTIHCHVLSGHGSETFVQSLCNSCNPAFATMGMSLGADKFYQYYSAFGFSEKTGIDLPGEASDIFFSDDGEMSIMDLAVASFGQNFSITPIQMLTATAAVANGGYLVQPHVVDKIIDDDGNIVKSYGTTVKRQVISEDVSNRMCSILQQNAIDGSGSSGYISGYRICGKTGTSEKIADYNQNGGNMTYISSYCGFAPADDPQVALLVFFDDPEGPYYYGSMVAGPAFKSSMENILPYLGIEKKYTENEAEEADISTPSVIGHSVSDAKSMISSSNLGATVYGSGDTVIRQVPEAGQSVPQGGTVALYTDDSSSSSEIVEVPSFINMSAAEVQSAANSAGLNVRTSGKEESGSIARTQSIAAGSKVNKGTVITVEFSTNDGIL